MVNIKKFLVLSTHTGDGESGCGGSIARFLEEKREVCTTKSLS